MHDHAVTIAVVPRERFSFTARSLECLLANTSGSARLIYVDAGSPPPVRDYLQEQAAQHGFDLIRCQHYLSPNQARNLAARYVRTKYVAFIDNDALPSPGWLDSLVSCAEATGAWVVGPIYCEQEPMASRIHMAGGMAHFKIDHGRRVFFEEHSHWGEPLAEIGPTLERQPVEQIEFHCALLRMTVFDTLGPLDEGLLSAAEHTDLCLLTRKLGGDVFLEPRSVVTYVPPTLLEPSDLPYFQLRWSHAWNEASIERFRAKWDLGASDPGMTDLRQWLKGHRRLALEKYRRVLRVFGRRPARLLEKVLLAPLEEVSNRLRFHDVPRMLQSQARQAAAA